MIRSHTVFYNSKEFPFLGRIYVAATEKGLCQLALPGRSIESFFERVLNRFQPHFFTEHTDPFQDLYQQLERFFTGSTSTFSLPLDLQGTPFQCQVWEALKAIPYGETRSYTQIARAIDRPKACRAVGQANHQNPIPIVIPCHRVIGAQGNLVGYGSGLPLKEKLLDLERKSPGH
jgi:O-6-methylguanine DNA methyltransferase